MKKKEQKKPIKKEERRIIQVFEEMKSYQFKKVVWNKIWRSKAPELSRVEKETNYNPPLSCQRPCNNMTAWLAKYCVV